MLLPKSLRSAVRNAEIVSKLRRDFEKASKMQDVGERMLAMLRVEHAAEAQYRNAAEEIYERARGFHLAAYLGLIGGGMVAGIAIAATGGGAIGMAVMLGGVGLGFANLVTGLVESVTGAVARNKVDGFMLDLLDTSRKAGEETDNMLKNNIRDLAASAHFSTIYDHYPETRDHFVKAFNAFASKMDNVGLVPPVPSATPATPSIKAAF